MIKFFINLDGFLTDFCKIIFENRPIKYLIFYIDEFLTGFIFANVVFTTPKIFVFIISRKKVGFLSAAQSRL